MSVPPLTSPAVSKGPPPVSSSIALKLLKLKAKELTSSGATATRSRGAVMRRVVWMPVAPSTLAASLTSDGIDWRAPVHTMNM